jgi:acid phosphatase (class A)
VIASLRLLVAASAALGLLLAGSSAGAASHHFAVISAEDVQPALVLPPPPADGSPQARAELDELHRIARTTTAAAWAAALWDNEHEDGGMFASVFGTGFDLKALPATAKLLADVRNEEATAASLAKDQFKRKRPWILDPSLRTCSRDEDPLSSYPSGHSTMAFAMAVALSRAAPELATRLMARASQYAGERLTCGMHFRSDIVAGQSLGSGVAVLMLRDPKILAEVAAARAELLAAHLIPTAS